MRSYFLIFIFLTSVSLIRAQELNKLESGKVSYISSQNVYVKFASTENINVGDTLYVIKNDRLTPSLIVKNTSSISCVCTPVGPDPLNIADEVFFQGRKTEQEIAERDRGNQQDSLSAYSSGKALKTNEETTEARNARISNRLDRRQRISGRLSAASYNTIANSESNSRFRYTFLLEGNHLGNTGFSFESYVTFRHILGRWDDVKEDVHNALKVYALSVKYDFNSTTHLLLGRNLNPRISSIGASDGLQFEKGFGNFTIGTLVGSRPDYRDYSLNFDLFQYGVYLSHELSKDNKYFQHTVAFIEQTNDFKTDRRFIYFQHTGSLAANLSTFVSMELSLYENFNNEPKNTVDLNNLYASIRYRPIKPLSLFLSYDNRKDIQYFETYKNYIDSLIASETRQGLRFHATYRINKSMIWGVNTAWRFQKNDGNVSRNLNSYLTFTRIPGVDIRTTLTVNFLQTNYLNSKIFGIRLSKEMVPRKLNMDINYRWVDYDYLNYEMATRQNIIGANLSWNIIKRLSLYLNYEITLDNEEIKYHQIFTKLIQRF